MAALVPSLLVWGGVDEAGVPFLEPAFVVDATPTLPDSAGVHRITGRASGGGELFSFGFHMPDDPHGENTGAGFVFAVPVRPGWANALASITLSGPGRVLHAGRGDGPSDGHPARPVHRAGARLSARLAGRDAGRPGHCGALRRAGPRGTVQSGDPGRYGVAAVNGPRPSSKQLQTSWFPRLTVEKPPESPQSA